MTRKLLIAMVLTAALAACQSAAPAPTPAGVWEMSAAATAGAEQASAAAAATEQAAALTRTAAIPTLTQTPESTSTPSSQGYMVRVPASECWFPSGVELRANQEVTIFASGTVNTWDGKAGSDAEASGHPKSVCGDIRCPMQGMKYGALIGRLGDADAFLVGKQLKFTAATDGELYFTVNDWECSDNQGAFDVGVRVR